MHEHIKQSDFEAVPRQAARLLERRRSAPIEVDCAGLRIEVDSGVYDTSIDSELLAASVQINPTESFLEIGSGSGIVSLLLAPRAKYGVATDINARAVRNSARNAKRHNVTNVQFLQSDVFRNVRGTYDVIACNPPYTKHDVSDVSDRMFWDPADAMKRTLFREASNYLNPGGRLYVGWADFADLDVDLPFTLAKENGFTLANTFSKPHQRNEFNFYVLEFTK